MTKTTLPKWAFPYRSRSSSASPQDFGAQFYAEDRCTITVELIRREGAWQISFSRSGLDESEFSSEELCKVMELLNLFTQSVL